MQLNIRKTKNSLIKMDRRLKQIFSKEDTQMANNQIKRPYPFFLPGEFHGQRSLVSSSS